MKKVLVLPTMLMGVALSFTSCGDNDDPGMDPDVAAYDFKNLPADSGVKPTEEQMSAVVATFVDEVVLPTYEEMLAKMTDYKNAVDRFAASGDKNDLADACDAWRAVRVPWEQSEAFLFGVADLAQLDPSLDSWPLDKNGIEEIIATGEFGKISGSVDEEAEDGPQNLRGFHTAEKMLFLDGEPRDPETSPFAENELEYLKLVSERMLSDTRDLYNGWLKGLGTADIPTSYAEAMKRHDGSAYSIGNVYQAIELMLNGNNGMAGISNEVGSAKITDPVTAWEGSNKDASDPNNPGVLAVESWYSWNSLDDYKNNIVSIKNAYFGGCGRDAESASANSLHALTRRMNPTLDSLMVVQIDKTIDAINAIGYPFRNNLGDTEHINTATDACADLTTGLEVVKSKFTH